MTDSDNQPRWPWEAGLRWALFMLALELGECLVLTEVVFRDRSRAGLASDSGSFLEIYFFAVLATLLLQAAGIVLVILGRYRIGAIFQLVSSGLHVSKIEGVIGIVGGLKAWKYERPAEDAGTGLRGPEIEAEEQGIDGRQPAAGGG